MDDKRREEIFSKESISTRELQEIFEISMLANASLLMTKIKQATGDRLGIKGKIHIADYCKYFGIETDRYINPQADMEIPESIHPKRKMKFSAGYHEWNVFINGRIAYTFDDFSELINKDTTAKELAEMLIEQMTTDEEKGVRLNKWEIKDLKQEMIDRLNYHYGLDKENK